MQFTFFYFKLYTTEFTMIMMVFLSTVLAMCSTPELQDEKGDQETATISNVQVVDSSLHSDELDSKRIVEEAPAEADEPVQSSSERKDTNDEDQPRSVLDSEPNEELTTGVYQGEPEMLEEEGVHGSAILDSGYVDDDEESLDQHSPDHQIFSNFLGRHVTTSGVVDYLAIKAEIDVLDAYLKALKEHPVAKDWSRNAELSYWINAYNAFTIKLIIDHYPVESIMDIENGKPWDKKWIELGDQTYSLNQIEHEIIRPRFGDARIHFAVNCAARSCPPLANRAFTEANIDQLLNERTRIFINDNKYNILTKTAIKISKIFDWYSEDFGNVITYVNKYTSIRIEDDASVDFLDYDWKLNGK